MKRLLDVLFAAMLAVILPMLVAAYTLGQGLSNLPLWFWMLQLTGVAGMTIILLFAPQPLKAMPYFKRAFLRSLPFYFIIIYALNVIFVKIAPHPVWSSELFWSVTKIALILTPIILTIGLVLERTPRLFRKPPDYSERPWYKRLG
ncbi:hypothetical protein [Deinococcus sp.]|uniref:hypothetical protein n=1 Tax=Deinococcus sp. TaxID=47478 RepID=UPI003B59B363